jgi:hypothetical protein
MDDETYTDFMVRCMTGEDAVTQAFVIVRRSDGSIGYRSFRQECADTLGMLRVTALSVENDLTQEWRGDR